MVKSQSDASMLYACKMTKDGSYMCCSNNLNRCGGLNSGGPLNGSLTVPLSGRTA